MIELTEEEKALCRDRHLGRALAPDAIAKRAGCSPEEALEAYEAYMTAFLAEHYA